MISLGMISVQIESAHAAVTEYATTDRKAPTAITGDNVYVA